MAAITEPAALAAVEAFMRSSDDLGAITVGSVLAGAATALGVEKAALKEHKPAIKVRIGTLLDELLAAQAEAASAPAAATAEDASGSSSDGGDSDSDDDDDDSDGADDSDGDAAVDMAGAQEGADPGGLVSIGKDIEVYWKDDAKFYGCKIYGFEPDTGKYKLMYADGDEEEVVLKEEKWRWQKEKKDKLDARIAALDKAVTKRYGEVCWATLEGFPPWPSMVYDPRHVTGAPRTMATRELERQQLVAFYGTSVNDRFCCLPFAGIETWEAGVAKGYQTGALYKGRNDKTTFAAGVKLALVDLELPFEKRFQDAHMASAVFPGDKKKTKAKKAAAAAVSSRGRAIARPSNKDNGFDDDNSEPDDSGGDESDASEDGGSDDDDAASDDGGKPAAAAAAAAAAAPKKRRPAKAAAKAAAKAPTKADRATAAVQKFVSAQPGHYANDGYESSGEVAGCAAWHAAHPAAGSGGGKRKTKTKPEKAKKKVKKEPREKAAKKKDQKEAKPKALSAREQKEQAAADAAARTARFQAGGDVPAWELARKERESADANKKKRGRDSGGGGGGGGGEKRSKASATSTPGAAAPTTADKVEKYVVVLSQATSVATFDKDLALQALGKFAKYDANAMAEFPKAIKAVKGCRKHTDAAIAAKAVAVYAGWQAGAAVAAPPAAAATSAAAPGAATTPAPEADPDVLPALLAGNIVSVLAAEKVDEAKARLLCEALWKVACAAGGGLKERKKRLKSAMGCVLKLDAAALAVDVDAVVALVAEVP